MVGRQRRGNVLNETVMVAKIERRDERVSAVVES
jgi:hypothetical protein